MRFNDLPEKCKSCQHLKAWSLDMGGNHGMTCRKGSKNLKKKECEEYEPYTEEES
jgi:hypothetical protein